MPRCTEVEPAMTELLGGHIASCHLLDRDDQVPAVPHDSPAEATHS
jgi:hypothetical protein